MFTESGGIEVARTEERMQELRRRMSSARRRGASRPSCSRRTQVVGQRAVPRPVESSSAASTRRASAWSTRCAPARSCASARRSWTRSPSSPTSRCIGMDVERRPHPARAHHRRRHRDRHRRDRVRCVEPEARPDGRRAIPLTPAVHQMISVGPIPQLAERPGEISFPIVRDMDTFCYERQHGSDMEVGSYAHRPILHDPDDIPSIDQAKLSPTELPFTDDDFDPQLEQALELMPDAARRRRAPRSATPSTACSRSPPTAPRSSARRPRSRACGRPPRSGSRRVPGVGRAVAEWMTDGNPEIDVHHADIARFYPHQRTRAHIRARTDESFNKTYGIVHPAEQWASNARTSGSRRCTPASASWARCSSRPPAGSGRTGTPRTRRCSASTASAVMPREHEWDARWWSPIINAEHLAMRERAGIVDLSAFAIFDVIGPGALDAVQGIVVAQVRRRRRSRDLHADHRRAGGFRSDLTIMRLADDHYRVVTGGAARHRRPQVVRRPHAADGARRSST